MRSDTAALLAFVWNRTEEALRDAEDRGDDLGARFVRRSLTTLTDIRANLDAGHAIGDLMAERFLRRLAQNHSGHHEFREEWRS